MHKAKGAAQILGKVDLSGVSEKNMRSGPIQYQFTPASDELVIQYCHPDELLEYERNAKKHSREQIEQLAGLMDKYGVTQPVVVDENMVLLMGHGRRLAFIHRGMTRVPYVMRRGLTEAAKRAIRLADNRVSENSSWDEEMLRLELKDLNELGEVGMENLLGFDQDEMVKLLNITGAPPPPDGVDLKQTWQVVIDCTDESQQVELLERLQAEGLKCKALIG
jgi:ParB-like chromosome segregation protein Spo0J